MGWGGSYGVVCGVVGQLWGAAGCYRQLWGRNGGLGCAMGQLWGSMKPLWGGLGGGCHEAPIGWWWWGGSSGAHRVAVGWMGAMCRGSLWGRALTNPPPRAPQRALSVWLERGVAGFFLDGIEELQVGLGGLWGAEMGSGGSLGGRTGGLGGLGRLCGAGLENLGGLWGRTGGLGGAGGMSLWGRNGGLGGSVGQDWGI